MSFKAWHALLFELRDTWDNHLQWKARQNHYFWNACMHACIHVRDRFKCQLILILFSESCNFSTKHSSSLVGYVNTTMLIMHQKICLQSIQCLSFALRLFALTELNCFLGCTEASFQNSPSYRCSQVRELQLFLTFIQANQQSICMWCFC